MVLTRSDNATDASADFRQLLLRTKEPTNSRDLFLAIIGGICSSLSTISSFINDIANLSGGKRYLYLRFEFGLTQKYIGNFKLGTTL